VKSEEFRTRGICRAFLQFANAWQKWLDFAEHWQTWVAD
jgi:hypothetical protein